MTSTVRGAHLVRLLGQWHALPGRRRSPDYAALAGAIRGLLADGRLPLAVRLPAERELAEALKVSRTTVTAAYRQLRETGHLTSRRGAGSWTTLPAGHRVVGSGLWSPLDDRDVLDLGCAALAAPAELPEAARAATEDLTRHLGGAGYHPVGIPELREAVAAAYADRGLPTSADQIMITNGTQHALDLVLRLLVPAGAGVLVESPTYPNALAALGARRARIATHGVGESGWDAELLLGTLRQTGPRLAYLIPEFHNPTGHLMSADLRERLVAAAHVAGTDLVVDESFVDLALGPVPPGLPTHLPRPLAEARRDGGSAQAPGPARAERAQANPALDAGPMPPPVAVFDRRSRVISIGGMSKPYWGGLRIGWVRASAPLVQRLAAVRVGVDMAGPVLDQLVAVRLLARAGEIVPARRAQLAAQRDALVAALRREVPEWRYAVPAGGVTLWAELDGPVSSALSRAAEDVGVRLAPGPRFGLDGTLERFLRLPFTLPAADLVEAVQRIAAVRYDLDRAARPRWADPAVIA